VEELQRSCKIKEKVLVVKSYGNELGDGNRFELEKKGDY
jgi:hypothetical protein